MLICETRPVHEVVAKLRPGEFERVVDIVVPSMTCRTNATRTFLSGWRGYYYGTPPDFATLPGATVFTGFFRVVPFTDARHSFDCSLHAASGQETSNVNVAVSIHIGPDDRRTIAIRLSHD